MPTLTAFATRIYRHKIFPSSPKASAFHRQILKEVRDLMDLDSAGRRWSKENYFNGFTSYGSANELHRFSSTFADLEKRIDREVAKFARQLDFQLGGKPLRMTNCWVNVMHPNTHHGMHIHPLSVISGTYYVRSSPEASKIKFEDPRLGLFMAAPPRKSPCKPLNRTFVELKAESGSVVLFESWLRHEVPLQKGKTPRISISFNYGWGD
jgi:uncharacterized protein (TIGR02466 family)